MTMIGKTISHYKIIGKIGAGGRGVVYKADDLDLNRTVALKFISPHLADNKEDLESLYREARSASKVNHHNITTIYEIGHSGKHDFIAMEYLDGETLKEKIKRESLQLEDILNISTEILNGIKIAHENNLIHRDIKAENVMITKSGVVKVMDFGLARSLERDDVTKVSTTLGTIAYMAPEQIEGSKVDQRSDIYSFGVVLYEMLTGGLPFVGEHEAATLYSIVNESIPDIIGIAPDSNKNLVAIIEKTLEKKPEHRYQNAAELLDDLKELRKGTTTHKFKRKPKFIKFIRDNLDHKWVIGGVSLLLLLGVLTLYFTGIIDKSPSHVKSLAVLNFENMSQADDPNRLGQILQELIIADLSDIPHLKVFSSQRLFDIQTQLGSENRTSIDRGIATNIAQKAGAEAMLTGNIIQRGINMILTSQLVNVEDGSIIKSHQVEGNDIYAMVDDLTTQIQTNLQLPEDKGDRVDIAVAEKTSSSVNAFQYYFVGVDYFNNSHFTEAIEQFQQAIAIDSTFSNAYYKLAMAQWWSQSELNDETIENAQRSLQKVLDGSWYRTTKEKLLAQGSLELTKQNFIEAEEIYLQLIEFIEDEKEAWYGLGEAYFHGRQDFEKAAEAFERAIELDPGFTVAYRHIFDIYKYNEEYDSGIIRATQLIDDEPENVWGYIFLGQMFLAKEEFDRANQTFEEALEIDHDLPIIYQLLTKSFIELKQFEEGISFTNNVLDNIENAEKFNLLAKMYIGIRNYNRAIDTLERGMAAYPNSYSILVNLINTYLLNGNYQQAISQCQIINNDYQSLWDTKGIYLLSSVYNQLGQYSKNIELSDQLLSMSEESDKNIRADIINNWAYNAYLCGNTETAKRKLDEALSISDSPNILYINYLIESFILAKNRELADLLNLSQVMQDSLNSRPDDKFLSNIIKAINLNYYFASIDYRSAVQEFESMDDIQTIKDRYLYYAGIAYFELGNIDKVEEVIQKMEDPFLHGNIRSFVYPRSFYLKGLLHEASGNLDQAKQSYQYLLNLWQNGDKNGLDYQMVLQRFNRL